MFDCYWFGNVDCILFEVLVLVVYVQCQEEWFGGVVNVVCNVVMFGGQVGLLCVVGCDEFGEWIVELFGSSGVMLYFECDLVLLIMIKLCVFVCQQ